MPVVSAGDPFLCDDGTPFDGKRGPSPRTGGPVALRRRRERFWRWYRLVPVAALALTLALGGVSGLVPTSLMRQLVYPVEHSALVKDAADRHGLDPLLVCAVIKCESGWDEDAISDAGAVGLMQVMPSTAQSLVDMGLVDEASYDLADLTNPEVNLEYGCTYLAYLEGNLSSLSEVVAAYNAGLGAVQEWVSDGSSLPEGIEYAETSVYLERVLAAYEGYQQSYPDGITGA